MMKERICELLGPTSFEPFIIQTARGKAVPVAHPNFILAAGDAPHVIVEEPNGRNRTLDVMLITALEKASPQESAP